MNPDISVIIPLYNKKSHISRALNSVLAQTVTNFEIIVVNDGSTDGGEKIVEEYVDSRIILINQKNQGVSVARNNGVGASKSNLIAFLDADDEWLPSYLETILRLREKYPQAGIYATGYSVCFPNNVRRIKKTWGIENDWEGIVSSIFRVAAMDGYFCGCTPSTVIPKDVFLSQGGFKVGAQLGEDMDLWGRVSLDYPYVFTSESLVIVHDDAENKLTRTNKPILGKYPFQEYIDRYPTEKLRLNPHYCDILLYLDSLNCEVALNFIHVGQGSDARIWLQKVHHNELFAKKKALVLYSYVPKMMLPLIRKMIWLLRPIIRIVVY